MFTYGQETYRLAYPDYDTSSSSAGLAANNAYVSYGLPFSQACAMHLSSTFQASKVYILCSKSLANGSNALAELKQALGEKVVGDRVGMTAHTMWSEVLQVVNECRDKAVDAIVTLGAGSLTDAAKLVAYALANDVKGRDDFLSLPTVTTSEARKALSPDVPILCIPTSLSGGEYNHGAGATDDISGRKHQFPQPCRGPQLIILDPGLTLSTPERLWLSSGVRAIDHCTETLCSLESDEESDAMAASGLRLLIPALTRCKEAPEDLEARHQAQLGVIDAMGSIFVHGVHGGASHGIGHMLGPMGVGHGETSCVLLPAVCKYNRKYGPAEEQGRQAEVLRLLWTLDSVKELKIDEDTAELGDVLDRLFRVLGMPRSLKEVGVEGDEKLNTLAENSLHDKWCGTNPVPLESKGQILEILEMVRF